MLNDSTSSSKTAYEIISDWAKVHSKPIPNKEFLYRIVDKGFAVSTAHSALQSLTKRGIIKKSYNGKEYILIGKI